MARYFGFEPDDSDYYFVSYFSRSDSRIAPIARQLHEGGVRLWYDRGLFGAEEWETQIAEKIRNCKAMVVFVTKELLYSEDSYVIDEFRIAKLRQKKIYVVFLDTDIDSKRINDHFATFYTKITSLHGVWAAPHEENTSIAERVADMLGTSIPKPKPNNDDVYARNSEVERHRAEEAARKRRERAEQRAAQKEASAQVSEAPAGGKRGVKIAAAVVCLALVIGVAFWGVGYWEKQEELKQLELQRQQEELRQEELRQEEQKRQQEEQKRQQDEQSRIDLEFDFTKAQDGYIVHSYCGTETDVVIPESYDGLPVIGINKLFTYSPEIITSISIPSSVTSIGEAAFFGCTKLTSITLPNNVTSIGNEAFYCCSNLTSITIPDSVTSIGNSAFMCCDSLASIIIPKSVTRIGFGAFSCLGIGAYDYLVQTHNIIILAPHEASYYGYYPGEGEKWVVKN